MSRHQAIRDRGAEDLELERCRRDVVHWVNAWAWTYDPQRQPSIIPFDLFPKQEEFLLWLSDREARQESGVVEKSREVGVTFLCCAYALHRWLFRPGCQICFASRKLEYVDRKGDPKCIFEKIRFILYHLPPWMLPAGFRRKSHDHEAKLVNPDSGSTITGEGATRSAAAVGRRCTSWTRRPTWSAPSRPTAPCPRPPASASTCPHRTGRGTPSTARGCPAACRCSGCTGGTTRGRIRRGTSGRRSG